MKVSKASVKVVESIGNNLTGREHNFNLVENSAKDVSNSLNSTFSLDSSVYGGEDDNVGFLPALASEKVRSHSKEPGTYDRDTDPRLQSKN